MELTAAFVALVALMSALVPEAVFVAARRLGESKRSVLTLTIASAVAIALLLVVSDRLAVTGTLLDFELRPPAFARFVGAVTVLTLLAASSRFGSVLARGLPVAVLVGFQVFRLPVEVFLHFAGVLGLVPVQMTFSGRNFDILVGLTALPVAYAAHRGRLPRAGLLLWNVLGLGLLLNIVVVANLSTPAFHVFEEQTSLLATRPFIWLPAILVQVALLGHVLVFRRLSADRSKVARTDRAPEITEK